MYRSRQYAKLILTFASPNWFFGKIQFDNYSLNYFTTANFSEFEFDRERSHNLVKQSHVRRTRLLK